MTVDSEKLKLREQQNGSQTALFAVTGTFHGSIIEAESEGNARRAFHKHYNGESITHVKQTKYYPV